MELHRKPIWTAAARPDRGDSSDRDRSTEAAEIDKDQCWEEELLQLWSSGAQRQQQWQKRSRHWQQQSIHINSKQQLITTSWWCCKVPGSLVTGGSVDWFPWEEHAHWNDELKQGKTVARSNGDQSRERGCCWEGLMICFDRKWQGLRQEEERHEPHWKRWRSRDRRPENGRGEDDFQWPLLTFLKPPKIYNLEIVNKTLF